ncbi:MAG: hypothetical protein Q7S89_02010 [bacterium]|nr:hypothetical protein [bacterium]
MVLDVLKQIRNEEQHPKTRELHPDVASFLDSLGNDHAHTTGPFIEVSDVVRTLGKVYERLRTVVDYRDEHLLRKAAIERILKRRFDPAGDLPQLARAFVEELIRAGYIANGTLPESKLKDITAILKRYATIESAITADDPKLAGRPVAELRGIMAAELDEFFGHDVPVASGVRVLGKLLREHLVFRGAIDERERDIQILLACERALHSLDRSSLSYALLRASIRDWDDVEGERAAQFGRNFGKWSSFFAASLNHPLRYRLMSITKRYAVLMTLLFDISKHHPGQMRHLAQSVEEMHTQVLDAYLARYSNAKKRLRRGAFRAIIYLLLTKFLLAALLEVPYDIAVIGHITWLPLSINLAFPPLFMFIVALFIDVPSKRNTGAVVTGMEGFLGAGYAGNLKHEIRVRPRRRGFISILANAFYLVTYVITFGAIVWVLRQLGFTLLGVLIFVFFLTVVSFFGIRIRRNVRELLLFAEAKGGYSTLIDFFTFPIVRAGQWLSESFQRINVFVFILDIFIEAPLQIALEVLEHFIAFFREKKEEVY